MTEECFSCIILLHNIIYTYINNIMLVYFVHRYKFIKYTNRISHSIKRDLKHVRSLFCTNAKSLHDGKLS